MARKSSKSELEELFAQAWRDHAPADAPEPKREYRWAAHQVGLAPGVRKRLAAAGLRDWRFDFAWVVYGSPSGIYFDGTPRTRLIKVAVEIEGGIWGPVIKCPYCKRSTGRRGAGGRHTRGAGFVGDADKYNLAQSHGWTVYRATSEHLGARRARGFVEMIVEAIRQAPERNRS